MWTRETTANLNDLWDGMANAGIFHNFPEDSPFRAIADQLDLAYSARSGEKTAQKWVARLFERYPADALQKLATSIYVMYGNNWERAFNVLLAEYEPLENYNMIENTDREDTLDKTTNDNLIHGHKIDTDIDESKNQQQEVDTTPSIVSNTRETKNNQEQIINNTRGKIIENENTTRNQTERTEETPAAYTDTQTTQKGQSQTVTETPADTTEEQAHAFDAADFTPSQKTIRGGNIKTVTEYGDGQEDKVTDERTFSGPGVTEKSFSGPADNIERTTEQENADVQSTRFTGTPDTVTDTPTLVSPGREVTKYTGHPNHTDNTETHSGEDKREITEKGNPKSHQTLTRHGNIGVTTSQQMLLSEIDVRRFNLFDDIIFVQIDRYITLEFN